MQELILEGSYFSDEEMRERDEKLHYQMIGKFEVYFIYLFTTQVSYDRWSLCTSTILKTQSDILVKTYRYFIVISNTITSCFMCHILCLRFLNSKHDFRTNLLSTI